MEGLLTTLGARIRELRFNRNFTLEQVGAETGLSISFLSMVERDKVSISVDNLEKLAHCFDIHMVNFFNTPEESPVMITRREQIAGMIESKRSNQSVVTFFSNKPDAKIEPLLITFAPGVGEVNFSKHEGEVFLYVLAGQANLISDLGDNQIINQGDLAYYVNQPHRRLANASIENPLVILSITAPPSRSLGELNEIRNGSWVIPEKNKH
jgi:transcriptional regulator with XRE-family HTH domain